MKHESFKHSLQDQTPGEPECLLFMTNGVKVRESNEGVTGRKPGQATAAPPHPPHHHMPQVWILATHIKTVRKWTRKRLKAKAQLGLSESGSLAVEQHCPLQAQLQLRAWN